MRTPSVAASRSGCSRTCPPVSEYEKPIILYPQRGKRQYPHHAAVFAATRWTNVFDLGNLVFTGDPISGSMAENFGPGVENIQVKMQSWARIFTHTKYWSSTVEGAEVLPNSAKGRSHLQVMRDAVDLRRRLEP